MRGGRARNDTGSPGGNCRHKPGRRGFKTCARGDQGACARVWGDGRGRRRLPAGEGRRGEACRAGARGRARGSFSSPASGRAASTPYPSPCPPAAAGGQKDRNPLTAASRIAALLFAGRARNVVLERMASIYIMLCLRFASFFRLKPQKPHLLPLCRFHRGTLFRH